MISAALFIHIVGGVLNTYHTIPYYDDIAHLVSSVLIAFLSFVIIYLLDKYWDGLHMDMYAMAFVVVVATMAMGVIWEFMEWGTDLALGTREQWGLEDTLSDLFIDMIGGIGMAIIGVSLIKKGRFETMIKELGKQIDATIFHRTKS
jgi:peptidoglycan biosynthesis protein MviN/MurJ (putative lipid II flippase)